ncbi:hypothetical protein MLD38_011574 [Melastoma candidum]|uniref:Uncharacterized protein n=1 Tax=Melastoma candidum TaxID=119954 RepID=A0ACB9R3J3_9MYRT|nr:hypothetical protein MLD38_011574 [Melastoma candidum]
MSVRLSWVGIRGKWAGAELELKERSWARQGRDVRRGEITRRRGNGERKGSEHSVEICRKWREREREEREEIWHCTLVLSEVISKYSLEKGGPGGKFRECLCSFEEKQGRLVGYASAIQAEKGAQRRAGERRGKETHDSESSEPNQGVAWFVGSVRLVTRDGLGEK